MGPNTLTWLAVILIAVGFGYLFDPDERTKPSSAPIDVFNGLARFANKPLDGLSFALGYNVCLDAIVRAGDVLDLPADGDIQAMDLPKLDTANDVKATFMHFFANGAAGERSCAPAVLESMVATAQTSPTLRKSLGGNAALMARRLAAYAPTAKRILLGGPVGPDAAALLPPSVSLASPPAPSDEVHLILEYAHGEALGGAAAPRANRFIVTADEANADAGAMLATIAAADGAPGGVDSLTVAGLHMLEPLPAAQREAALASVAGALGGRSVRAPVHIELASCADPSFVRAIAASLFPLASSVGFNEQEGAFLYEALGGAYGNATGPVPGPRSDVASTAPVPASVAGLLRFLLEAHPSLSRLHYHSLAFHVLAYRSEAAGTTWRGNAGAVAAGSVAATTEACGFAHARDATADRIRLIAPLRFSTADPRGTPTAGGDESELTSASPVASWAWRSAVGPVGFRLAPVAVCVDPRSTVGLGDAVSATGLAADVTKMR